MLLATSSFWQGVDVVGDQLSCVIIDKLPFASPGDPVTAARMEALTAEGADPFADYQVPLAILALLQGLGRLIRHRIGSRRAGDSRPSPEIDGLWPAIPGVAAAGPGRQRPGRHSNGSSRLEGSRRRALRQALPMRMPDAKTSAPPSTTCSAALQNGVSM